MAEKQSSSLLSSLAAKIMNGYEPTREEILSIAASVLSQDEVEGDAWGEHESQPVDEAEAREANAAPRVK